jgi:hypothetical protein
VNPVKEPAVDTHKAEIVANPDVSVEDWIGGVTFLQTKVTLYRNPAIYAEYKPLLDQIAAAEQELAALTAEDEPGEQPERAMSGADAEAPMSEPKGERALGEKPAPAPRIQEAQQTLDALYERAEQLYAAYEKDVEVWTLRKLSDDEIDAIRKELGGVPKQPTKPGPKAKPQARTAYVQKFEKWLEQMSEFADEVNLRAVAKAVVSVEVKGAKVPNPTLDDMRRFATLPARAGHLGVLVAALNELTVEGVGIAAPHRPRA